MMSSPDARDVDLARLLDRYAELQESDPVVGIEIMRQEAGELFDELAGLAAPLELFREALDEQDSAEVLAEFGPYEIEAEIGVGATARVYRARRRGEQRVVALKVMSEPATPSEERMERFRREAVVAERLAHPGIVRVLEHGEHSGQLFIAMELVEGESLDTVLREVERDCGVLPGDDWSRVLERHGAARIEGASGAEGYARQMARLFAPVARALVAAADMGLVHRDLKPANLILRRDGALLITDFGVARVIDQTMTATGVALGTPAYMSPEQATGKSNKTDARTDIYGFGATLYSALTLQFPFGGETIPETLLAIATQRPEPINHFCPTYPGNLAQVVARCMEREPEDRYPDGETLARDLERVAENKPPLLEAISMRRRFERLVARQRRALMVAATAAVLAIGLMFAWMARPAQLTIVSFPEATVALNGERQGKTRWSSEVSRGKHTVRILRDGFLPAEETFDLGAGEKQTWTTYLKPKDPFDPDALRVLSDSLGMQVTLPTSKPVRYRGLTVVGPDTPWQESVFLPTRVARVRPGHNLLVVCAAKGWTGLTLATGNSPARSLDLAEGTAILPVPDAPTARLTLGGATLKTRFEIVDPELPEIPSDVRGTDHGKVLEARILADAGLHAEAFALVWPLVEKHPGRALPLRLALDALAELGMESCPLYPALIERLERAR